MALVLKSEDNSRAAGPKQGKITLTIKSDQVEIKTFSDEKA